MDKGLELTKNGGCLSLIVPSAFLFQPRYIDIRRLLRQYTIQYIWNVGDKVFASKVVAPACIFQVRKQQGKPATIVRVFDTAETQDNLIRGKLSRSPQYRELAQSIYSNTTEEAYVTFWRPLRPNERPLDSVLECKDCGIKHQRVGCGMEQKGKSDLALRLYYEGVRQSPHDHLYLTGSDLDTDGWSVSYPKRRYFRGEFKNLLRKNEIVYFNEEVFDLPEKIVWRQTSDHIRAAIIGQHWFGNTLQAGIPRTQDYDLHYLLALLNSRFLNFVYRETTKESGRIFPQVKMGKVRALPFRIIDFSRAQDKAAYEEIIRLAKAMVSLHKQRASAKEDQAGVAIRRQIEATNRELNRFVYKLYDLDKSEIAAVETSLSRAPDASAGPTQ